MRDPRKSECPVVAGHVANENTSENTVIVASGDKDGNAKAKATLIARLALAGFAVHETADGAFLVTRWDLARHCGDLAALRAFARQVGLP